MSDRFDALFKTGGICFIISSILFLLKYLLDVLAGPPPSTGEKILVWVASEKLALSLVPEVLFFAGALLVPGVVALYYSLAKTDTNKAAFGCGMIALTIPVE